MEVLKNNNQANKEELIRYLKYFFMHYGTNYETIREQFISVFENISVYSKEACELMDQNLKSLISHYSF
jgi:predicted nucleotide-binding protein (sugar kinase/HSP70/actin superfamily)